MACSAHTLGLSVAVACLHAPAREWEQCGCPHCAGQIRSQASAFGQASRSYKNKASRRSPANLDYPPQGRIRRIVLRWCNKQLDANAE